MSGKQWGEIDYGAVLSRAALVSGFSPAIAKMVFSEALDPYQCLVGQLDSPRYDPVEAALAKVAA